MGKKQRREIVGKKHSFTKMIVQQGTREIKEKIKRGEVNREDIVKVEDELKTARSAVGPSSVITDDELRLVIVEVSHNCGLKTDCDELNLLEKGYLKVIEKQGTTNKDLILFGIRNELTRDARESIKKGKLDTSKPYDLKPNATRLLSAWHKNFVTGRAIKAFKITDEELTQMMREVLTEVGFEKIVEERVTSL